MCFDPYLFTLYYYTHTHTQTHIIYFAWTATVPTDVLRPLCDVCACARGTRIAQRADRTLNQNGEKREGNGCTGGTFERENALFTALLNLILLASHSLPYPQAA